MCARADSGKAIKAAVAGLALAVAAINVPDERPPLRKREAPEARPRDHQRAPGVTRAPAR